MNNMEQFLENYKKSPITVSLILFCALVYIVSVLLFGISMDAQQGIQFGAYNPVLVIFGHQYYRLLTANFIHFGILHIVVNCYSLYGLGLFVESVLKTKKYLIVIFVSALSTTGIPCLLFLVNGFESNIVSGGISGVIFGIIGAIGALALTYKDIFLSIFKQLAPNLLLMLLISFMVPSISLSGHVSGLIGGFVTTYILLHMKAKSKNQYSDLIN